MLTLEKIVEITSFKRELVTELLQTHIWENTSSFIQYNGLDLVNFNFTSDNINQEELDEFLILMDTEDEIYIGRNEYRFSFC